MTDPALISRFRKERYLRQLSEDDFRDTIVRPLFLRLGFSDGRDLCGPNEAGKDTVFTEIDRFGVTTVVAVQTKKGNLNLGSNVSQNVVSAITQLKTSLETTVTLLAPKQHVRPHRAYLCASGKINDAARAHIMREVSSPNITFLDTTELIPQIDRHIPEVWLGISIDLIPYFNAIRQLVETGTTNGSAQSGISSTGVFSVAASDSKFVPLSLFRTVLKTKKSRGKITKTPSIEELPVASVIQRKERRILILGEPGTGKSTALLRLAYTIAQTVISDEGNHKIPILARCLDIYQHKPATLATFCDIASRNLTGRDCPKFSAADLVNGRVTVLLDSLDELPNDEARSQVLTLIEELLLSYPRVQVIATSRPYTYTEHLQQLQHYLEYRISPMSWKQAKRILKVVRSNDRLTESQSQELLRRLEKIHGVALNPLLVTVFAATTDVSKQDIPANITELFKKFTELMLGRWDEAKGLHQQYQAPLKDFVLTKLAYYMHSRDRTSLKRVEAEEIVRKELLERGHGGDAAALLQEVFERSGLFRIIEDNIEFRHLLLQEFFAGRGIESVEQIKEVISNEWWKRALIFYFGDNPQHIDLLLDSILKVSGILGDDLAVAATTVGLALQACYLSPVSKKLDVWRWVNSTLSDGMEAFIRSNPVTSRHPVVGFAHYYLYGRDSTALSNLSGNLDELVAWSKSERGQAGAGDPERRLFWLISGLIESGDIEAAGRLIANFHPRDLTLLLGLSLGAHFVEKIRPVGQREKQAARDILKRLESETMPLRSELTKELDSLLLEMRDGKPAVIDHEADPDSDDQAEVNG